MDIPTVEEIVATASRSIFGKPLVTNVFRSVIAEALVAAALPRWNWCSADYASHDFEDSRGHRLEVKQTALKQTWGQHGQPRPSWDIRPRTGRWEGGNQWRPGVGRNADLYVFCLHAVSDMSADHRASEQWLFYVLPTTSLPATQKLSKRAAESLTTAVDFLHLGEAVGRVCESI